MADKDQTKKKGQYISTLIANSEIEKAIRELLKYFNNKGEFSTLRTQVLYVQSQYKKAKEDEERGLVSAENAKLNYNQIVSQLLGICDQLQSGEYKEEVRKRTTTRWLWIVLALLLIGGGAYVYLADPFDIVDPDPYKCPDSERGSDFKVVIAPFLPVDNQLTPIHNLMKARFEDVESLYDLPIHAGVLVLRDEDAFESYPTSYQDGDEVASNCAMDLFLWGKTQGTIVKRRFKFFNVSDSLSLHKLRVEEGKEIEGATVSTTIMTYGEITDTIPNLLTIDAGGLTGDVEKIMIGILSFMKGDTAKARALLYEAETADSTASLIKGCVLAEVFIQEGQHEEARKVYDEVLEKHPDYPLALNNRGMLNYREGRYEEAIGDLSDHLEKAPKDVSAWMVRGSALQNIDLLKDALEDFKVIQNLDKDNTRVNARINTIERQIQSEAQIKRDASQKLSRNATNLQALKDYASSSLKTGEYRDAEKAIDKILMQDPRDTTALRIKSKLLKNIKRLPVRKKIENN